MKTEIFIGDLVQIHEYFYELGYHILTGIVIDSRNGGGGMAHKVFLFDASTGWFYEEYMNLIQDLRDV